MSAAHTHRQGVLELGDVDIPLTLCDDPEIELGDLCTVAHVERQHPPADQVRAMFASFGWGVTS